MHAVVTGGTGMVGGSVLRRLLAEPQISKVTSISRHTSGLINEKLVEVIDADFGDPASLVSEMQGADILFHCIATYAHKVAAEVYETITVGYFDNVMSAMKTANPNATIIHFSASGAAPKGKSWYKALNTKGRAENALWATEFPRRITYRPGMIIPTRPENHKGFGDTVGKLAYRIMPFIGTTADELANVVVRAALS